jgi:hypothetical protein
MFALENYVWKFVGMKIVSDFLFCYVTLQAPFGLRLCISSPKVFRGQTGLRKAAVD